jgi:large subunit ribosomal protein L18
MEARRKARARQRRHLRVRRSVTGTPDRPRLVVFRSASHIYAQVIDDFAGHTLVAASSTEKDVVAGKPVEVAKEVGRLVGRRAVDRGIGSVVFDRGGFLYHGRVAALAEGARESGLKV